MDLEKNKTYRWTKEGKRLWVFSGSGTLHVMMRGDEPYNPISEFSSTGGVNPDNIVTTIIGIPNDGGDW